MFLRDLGIHHSEEYRLQDVPGDSNEVAAAKALLRIAVEVEGIADEMSSHQFKIHLMASAGEEAAIEVLRARDLL